MFKKILFFLPILVIVGAAAFILRFNPWYVKEVEVNLKNVNCASKDQIEKRVPLMNQNMLLIKSEDIGNKIKSGFICINSVDIQRSFPSKVIINADGRVPSLIIVPKQMDASTSAQVSNFLSDITPNEATPSSQSALLEDLIKEPISDGGNGFLVDTQGVVFSSLESPLNLQRVIFYNYDINIGERIESQIVTNAVVVFNKLKEMSLPVDLAIIKEKDLGIKSQNMSLFFALDKNIDYQIASLQLILQTSKINSEENSSSSQGYKKMSSVDLRFSKPVIVYSPK